MLLTTEEQDSSVAKVLSETKSGSRKSNLISTHYILLPSLQEIRKKSLLVLPRLSGVMTFTYLGSTHGTRFLPVKPRGDTFFAENVLTVQFRRLRQIIMANWTGAASSFQLLVTWTLAVPLGKRKRKKTLDQGM